MRVLGAIAGLAIGLAAAGGADAADLGVEAGAGYGRPAGMIVIWDSQPGVVTRAYWLPPWRNRHYFPSNGEMPEVGRDEDLTARDVPEPAQSYRRYWSTSPAVPLYGPEMPEPSLK